MRKLRYRVFEPLASLLPQRLLAWLTKHYPIKYEPSDGWNFWLDASYRKWVRFDKRKNPNYYG